MATLSLSSTTNSINATLSGISKVSYGRVFKWYFDGQFDSEDYIYGNVEPTNLTNYWSGLDSETSYTVEVIVENDETGSVVATFTKTISTKSEPNPVVMGMVSVSPTDIQVGGAFTLSWTYSGSGSASSYFDIYASQSPSFASETLVASVSYPNTSKYASSWSHPGVWYFRIKYRGNGSVTTNYVSVNVSASAWVSATPYVYHDGQWRPAQAYIYHNGWKSASPNIFKE